ncbi:CRAL-TRIO domain-containing protein [Lactarius vividus]|nr:CRAL-TRIO domain-containing protein [Lactarius vividus]
MILDCVHWRRTVEDVGIERLYRRIDPYDFPWREEVFESWPMGFHKTDRFGRPVNIQSFGAMNAKRLYRHITPEEHWRTVLVNVESLLAEVFPAASAAARRPIRQALVIIDLKGFGLAQFWALKSIARRSFEISQSYFPETMGQMLVINAPTSFTAIWSIIKPWLSPRTLDKITVLGTNQHHTILHDLVPPENLPAALGGTCTARWLRGEIAAPGVPWPPPPPAHEPEPEKTLAEEEEAAAEKLDVETEMDVDVDVDVDADLVEVEMGVEGSCAAAVTSSWGRTSVVGLPLPLPHTAARAPVRLVV